MPFITNERLYQKPAFEIFSYPSLDQSKIIESSHVVGTCFGLSGFVVFTPEYVSEPDSSRIKDATQGTVGKLALSGHELTLA